MTTVEEPVADDVTEVTARDQGVGSLEDVRLAVDVYNQTIGEAAAALPFDHPISGVRWVHVDDVQANGWNPNSVARNEMRLLHVSISSDGYTQPVVTVWDPEVGKYIIVDGFHRYTIMRTQQDVYDSTGGFLPIVVIDKPIGDRMASTVRHNRARGKHSVTGMSNLVFEMLAAGKSDVEICNEIGLEAVELLRLKHITGFSKLMENHVYERAWEAKTQVDLKGKWLAEHPDEPPVV